MHALISDVSLNSLHLTWRKQLHRPPVLPKVLPSEAKCRKRLSKRLLADQDDQSPSFQMSSHSKLCKLWSLTPVAVKIIYPGFYAVAFSHSPIRYAFLCLKFLKMLNSLKQHNNLSSNKKAYCTTTRAGWPSAFLHVSHWPQIFFSPFNFAHYFQSYQILIPYLFFLFQSFTASVAHPSKLWLGIKQVFSHLQSFYLH